MFNKKKKPPHSLSLSKLLHRRTCSLALADYYMCTKAIRARADFLRVSSHTTAKIHKYIILRQKIVTLTIFLDKKKKKTSLKVTLYTHKDLCVFCRVVKLINLLSVAHTARGREFYCSLQLLIVVLYTSNSSKLFCSRCGGGCNF